MSADAKRYDAPAAWGLLATLPAAAQREILEWRREAVFEMACEIAEVFQQHGVGGPAAVRFFDDAVRRFERGADEMIERKLRRLLGRLN